MLTVMRETADSVEGSDTEDLSIILDTASENALASVARTPTLLPVLYRPDLWMPEDMAYTS